MYFYVIYNSLAEDVFGVWGYKSLYIFWLINLLSLGSFNFLLTLDLTLSILSFFKLWYITGYPIPSLSFY